jgi:hypothetical protein
MAPRKKKSRSERADATPLRAVRRAMIMFLSCSKSCRPRVSGRAAGGRDVAYSKLEDRVGYKDEGGSEAVEEGSRPIRSDNVEDRLHHVELLRHRRLGRR